MVMRKAMKKKAIVKMKMTKKMEMFGRAGREWGANPRIRRADSASSGRFGALARPLLPTRGRSLRGGSPRDRDGMAFSAGALAGGWGDSTNGTRLALIRRQKWEWFGAGQPEDVKGAPERLRPAGKPRLPKETTP